MSKADRDMSLKTRLDAIEVVRNIRKARKLLTSSKFDDKLFDQIQGDDNGVDRLVGRSVMFGALSDTEKLALRREINAKLFESEQTAFGALREATLEYMTDLNKTIDGIKLDPTDEKVIMDLSSTKRKAIEAFEGAKLSAGTLDAERNLSALEHIEAIAERILDLTNGMTALLDEAENAEEQEGGDDDSKKEEETSSDGDDNIGNENEDENHDESGSDNEGDTAGEKGQGSELPTVDNPESIDEDDVADIKWINDEVNYFKAASKFMNAKDVTMKDAKFTPDKAKVILDKRETVNKKYVDALIKFKDVVAADTCTAESLMYGNKSFYDRYGMVIGLVATMEHLRAAVDKTCVDLVEASRKMLLETTKSKYV